MIIATFYSFLFLILIAFYFTTGEPNVAASASVQGLRVEGPQLRTLCLASVITSTREYSRVTEIAKT